MVLAIGNLAGATFVTLLAATATQFARAGRLWTLCTIEIEVAVRLGWSGMALAIDDLRGGGPVEKLPCGWAGRMTLAIDGRADVPLQHLSHEIGPRPGVLSWRAGSAKTRTTCHPYQSRRGGTVLRARTTGRRSRSTQRI